MAQIQINIESSLIDEQLEWFPVAIDLSDPAFADMWAELSIDPDDDFTGDDDSQPSRVRWPNINQDITIQSNKINATTDAAAKDINHGMRLRGDFDIQVDFDLVQHPSSIGWGSSLTASFQDDDGTGAGGSFGVSRTYSGAGDGYRSWKDHDGSSGTWGSQTNRDDLTGKLRITKVGKLFTAYAWYDSQWNQTDTM
ncbi:unnamed protein product, partial [marine sediment metagenome]